MKTTEEWARSAPAGHDLNYVCCEWIGWDGIYEDDMDFVCPYSTDWRYAGPLLEVMMGDLKSWNGRHRWCVDIRLLRLPDGSPAGMTIYAPTPQLAIARACAVLVANGIKKEDLR